MNIAKTLSLLSVLALVSCVKPPEIVMVDRATALEQQAAGSFDELEKRLDRAAIEPRPVPLTPEQLSALGVRPAPLVDGNDVTDADRVDAWLVEHCIGEANDGTLVETKDACRGATDPDQMHALLERVNRARRQLWRWLHDQRPTQSIDELRGVWRGRHVANVVCGGWLEGADGKWQEKGC